MKCLKCEADVSELVNYHTLGDEFIECPECGNKMVVEYEETWDGEEENQYWWLEQYSKEEYSKEE
jgi:DNA-directed RNA polymerase subunit RPC12/RpoP